MNNILANSKFDFTSDVVNIIVLIYDCSGSMESDVYAIREANRAFYSDFSRFEERKAVAISRCDFAEFISMSSFSTVDKFDTNYYAHGGTRLYKAISYAAKNTIEYYNELVRRLNIRPRITFLVFSDGCDNNDYSYEIDGAKQFITDLNALDATTVFVAFREAIRFNSGKELGFNLTRNISTVQELTSCLGTELSQSVKEQSRSAVSLKSKFFSQAAPAATGSASDEDTLSDDFFGV